MREAFHAKIPKKYTEYSLQVQDSYHSAREASAWIYDVLAKYGYKMCQLMGDLDGILSLPGAWKWIKARKFTVTKMWRPWISDETGELVGYLKEYGNFSLVTIHGEGHSAGATKDIEVPKFITNFIFDLPLIPDSNSID